MSADAYVQVPTHDGRVLEVLTGGDPQGFPLLFHSGTPSAAVAYPAFEAVVLGLGLRLVSYSRPGYGGSTPRPFTETGPRIVDDVADSRTVLDHLDIDTFVTLGWSGGGPRALACAALLPSRCRAAATLAGVAPFDALGLDWTADMGPENVAEFDAASQGATVYQGLLEQTLPELLAAGPEEVADAFGGLVTPVDRAFVTGDFAANLSEVFHRAGLQGVVGARDDGLAIVAPWGFEPAEIRVPVAVWQGRHDAMVPYAHGVWLAEHVAGAEAHLFDEEGHLSLFARVDAILEDLKRLSGIG